jgi:hypothetical protein
LLFAAWLLETSPSIGRRLELWLLASAAFGLALFGLQATDRDFFGFGHHATLALCLFALIAAVRSAPTPGRRARHAAMFAALAGFIVVSRLESLAAWLSGSVVSLATIVGIYGLAWWSARGRTDWRLSAFVPQSLAFATVVVGVTASAALLDRTYDSVWSPASVEQAASYLRDHTQRGDEVVSGAVIWELEADRRPFLRISHPLGYRGGFPTYQKRKFLEALQSHPPRTIILDGYTEKIYLEHLPELAELLASDYDLEFRAGPARYPIEIYLRREFLSRADAP